MNYKLKNIIKSFNVTPQVLDERKRIGLYIESLASLIIDRFYDYFLSNSEFSKLLNKSNLSRLKRVRIQFLISLFNDDFDDELINKISKLHIDSPIRVTPYIIASSFEILQQTIIDIASVNDELRRGLKTILKFLHIAEFLVQEEVTNSSNVRIKGNRTTLIKALESLYEMLSIHRIKSDKLISAWKNKKISKPYLKDLPSGNIEECPFNTILATLKKRFSDIEDFNIDINNIDKWHHEYHIAVNRFYTLVENKEALEKQKLYIEKIENISKNLFESISKPFEQSSSLTFLTVNSGMRFIKKYNDAIHETKFIPFNNHNKLVLFIKNLLEESLTSSLSWALVSYKVTSSKEDVDYDIYEEIILDNMTVYIYLTFKDIPYKVFIFDIVQMFLEILKTTIINREKEYALISLADRAESANRSKDMFLANMSHELRTPLNAIIGFSQILQTKKEIPANFHPYIEKISIAGNNLLNLVNTILDFAKLEAGKISYHPKMTLISDVTKEVKVLTSSLAEAKNIKIEFPGEISLSLYMDAQLIKQVLINLLSNSIKFTPENGKVKIAIKFDENKSEFILSVCDTGVGISKESIPKLFTPFTQIDNNLQSTSKGTGLGLVITKRIVEDLHGGRIWVQSEENKGTCFYISLPISGELSKVEMFPSIKEDAKNLLIVEDTEEYVNILVDKLNPKFNITVTNSTQKAKELLEVIDYDKIILDFFLIDGVSSEVIFFLESKNIKTPIYIISAEDDFKIVEHLQESKNIVGVFNKRDIMLICDTLIRAESE